MSADMGPWDQITPNINAIRTQCGDCFPHGPEEPCTCGGCWACDGRSVGCTCDIAWDCEHDQ